MKTKKSGNSTIFLQGIFLFLMTAAYLSAKPINADSLYFQALAEARTPATRADAMDACREILFSIPNYHDVRILLGRCYAWNHEYDDAEREFLTVLSADSMQADAANALLDVYLWSGAYEKGLDLASRYERLVPGESFPGQKKAKILQAMAESEKKPAKELPKYFSLANRSAGSGIRRSTLLSYSYTRLADAASGSDLIADKSEMEPWKLTTLEHTEYTRLAPLIFRINYAERFGISGLQGEVESYPVLGPGRYMYIEAGYSPDDLFPVLRFGAEYYQALPHAFEISGGLRYLILADESIPVWTTSLGSYLGAWYLPFKYYLAPATGNWTQSWTLAPRYYFGEATDYAEFAIGAGITPDTDPGSNETRFLGSRRLGFRIQAAVSASWIAGVALQLSNQEILKNTYRANTGFELVLSYRY